MNYLDNLPDDAIKIINREVQKAYIIKRRIERKNNRKINREQKEKAEERKNIIEKYIRLYYNYIEYQNNKKYTEKINKDNNYNMSLYRKIINEYGENVIETEEYIGFNEPYINAKIYIDGKIKIITFK